MKKFFVSILMVFCIFTLAGCGGVTESIFMETSSGIYDFYVNSLISAQNSYRTDINRLDAENSQKEKVDFAWNGQKIIEIEELAIISSIECYNLTSQPKELYLSDVNGIDLISVKQSRSVYECSLSKDNQKYDFSFSISRDATSKSYKVSYKQTILEEEKNCSASVIFDKSVSHLKIDTISYYETSTINTNNEEETSVEKIEVLKNFYNLVNNHKASQINVMFGNGNNTLLYSFNVYKQAIDSSLKIAKIEKKETTIDENNLSLAKFAQSTTNDICGYIVNYKSSQNKAETKTFGDMSKW